MNKSIKKKYYVTISITIFLMLTFMIFNKEVFAGTIENFAGVVKYKLEDGEYAKSTWVWLDDNNDAIAECYRFDENGNLAINYRDRYGKGTNERGQLIEEGIVVKKYLSSGLVINNNSTPLNDVSGQTIETINPNLITIKDKWTGKEKKVIVSETNSISEAIDGTVINNRVKKDIDILDGETAESGIIYVGAKPSKIGDSVKVDSKIIPGKDLRRYIKSKNKCKEKETEAYIYGGKRWNDVIVLSGDGASLKIDLKENNYIFFEVAHQNHREDDETAEMKLDMYIDGKWYSSYNEFVDSEPEVVEEVIERGKEIELKVTIEKGAKGRNVYIKNGRLKRIDIEE